MGRQGDEEARERIFLSNAPVVLSIARRHMASGLSLGALVQAGRSGLATAFEQFDPDRGFRFSTWATWWIRQRISRTIADR